MEFVYKWVNFCIFAGSLFYFVRTPLKDFLGDRRERLKREIEEIKRERLLMEQGFSEYRKKLAHANEGAQNLRNEFMKEGELEKQKLIKKAREFAQRIRAEASRTANQEITKAKMLLKKKALRLSVDLARDLLQKAVQPQDQEHLLMTGVKQLEKWDEGKSFS